MTPFESSTYHSHSSSLDCLPEVKVLIIVYLEYVALGDLSIFLLYYRPATKKKKVLDMTGNFHVN